MFWSLFLIKLQTCEFCEIFKNTYFAVHMRSTASDASHVVRVTLRVTVRVTIFFEWQEYMNIYLIFIGFLSYWRAR